MNKRARDQLQAFTEQRDTIQRKLAEVERSRASILDMMSQLEGKKDELLQRTYKQARHRSPSLYGSLARSLAAGPFRSAARPSPALRVSALCAPLERRLTGARVRRCSIVQPFEQIGKNLAEVWKELVPGGDIEFAMKTAAAPKKKRARAELDGARPTSPPLQKQQQRRQRQKEAAAPCGRWRRRWACAAAAARILLLTPPHFAS